MPTAIKTADKISTLSTQRIVEYQNNSVQSPYILFVLRIVKDIIFFVLVMSFKPFTVLCCEIRPYRKCHPNTHPFQNCNHCFSPCGYYSMILPTQLLPHHRILLYRLVGLRSLSPRFPIKISKITAGTLYCKAIRFYALYRKA